MSGGYLRLQVNPRSRNLLARRTPTEEVEPLGSLCLELLRVIKEGIKAFSLDYYASIKPYVNVIMGINSLNVNFANFGAKGIGV